METVQLQCGHCGQLMGVSVEHLGTQVQCPHCQQVVQVPDASAVDGATRAGDEDDLPKLRISTPEDSEDITTEGVGNSEDVFGGRPPPRLEIPPAAEVTLPMDDGDRAALRRKDSLGPVSSPSLLVPMEERRERTTPADAPSVDLPPPSFRKPARDSGIKVIIILMFLIPYSIATTGFIAYLLYQQRHNRSDPLEMLPDPKPSGKDGGPGGVGGLRQIQHDLPVNNRTTFNQTVRIGDVEVTPVKVVRLREGDLTLVMNLRNVSRDTEFNPMHDDFCHYHEGKGLGKPYVFLEPLTGQQGDRLYGGTLEWKIKSGNEDVEKTQSYRLRPGEQISIELTTLPGLKDREKVRKLIERPQDVVWRVLVRRGFMPTSKGPRSAAAVVGIEFNTKAIDKAT